MAKAEIIENLNNDGEDPGKYKVKILYWRDLWDEMEDRINEEIEKMEEKRDTLEQELEPIEDEISILRDGLWEKQQEIDVQNDEISNIEDNIQEDQEDIFDFIEEIQDIDKELDSAHEALEAAQEDPPDEGRIEQFTKEYWREKQKNIYRQKQLLWNRVSTDISRRAKILFQDKQTHEKNISGLTTAIASINATIAELEAQLPEPESLEQKIIDFWYTYRNLKILQRNHLNLQLYGGTRPVSINSRISDNKIYAENASAESGRLDREFAEVSNIVEIMKTAPIDDDTLIEYWDNQVVRLIESQISKNSEILLNEHDIIYFDYLIDDLTEESGEFDIAMDSCMIVVTELSEAAVKDPEQIQEWTARRRAIQEQQISIDSQANIAAANHAKHEDIEDNLKKDSEAIAGTITFAQYIADELRLGPTEAEQWISQIDMLEADKENKEEQKTDIEAQQAEKLNTRDNAISQRDDNQKSLEVIIDWLAEKIGIKLAKEIDIEKIKFDIEQKKKKLDFKRGKFPEDPEEDAWCADWKNDLEVGTEIGLIEIAGDRDEGINIYPDFDHGENSGSEYNEDRDGKLVPWIGMQNPTWAAVALAYFPGWQMWMPTTRIGTITAIDYMADTCSIELDEVKSRFQDLNVNQTDTLDGVEIKYMECHAERFVVGDEVVVRFGNQEWSNPEVIGFKEEPKPCEFKFYLKPKFNGHYAAKGGQRIRIKYTFDEIEHTQYHDVMGEDYGIEEGVDENLYKEGLCGPFVIPGEHFKQENEITIELHSDIKIMEDDQNPWATGNDPPYIFNKHAFTLWYEYPTEPGDSFARFISELSNVASPGIDGQILRMGSYKLGDDFLPHYRFCKRIVFKEAEDKFQTTDTPGQTEKIKFPGKDEKEKVGVFGCEFTGLKIMTLSRPDPVGIAGGPDYCTRRDANYSDPEVGYKWYLEAEYPELYPPPFNDFSGLKYSCVALRYQHNNGRDYQVFQMGNGQWKEFYLCAGPEGITVCSSKWSTFMDEQDPGLPIPGTAACIICDDETGENPTLTPMYQTRRDEYEAIMHRFEPGEEPYCSSEGDPHILIRTLQTEMVDTPSEWW